MNENQAPKREPSARELLAFFRQTAPPELQKAVDKFMLMQPGDRMELLMYQALSTSLELDAIKRALNGMAFTLQIVKQHLESLQPPEGSPPKAEGPLDRLDQDTADRYKRQIDPDHKDGEA